MKKYLFLTSLLFATYAHSQIPLFDVNKEQNWSDVTVFGSPDGFLCYTNTYRLGDFVTISNYDYITMIKTDVSSNPVKETISGYVRQEGDRYYFLKNKNRDTETILYDFSLEKNDHILLYGIDIDDKEFMEEFKEHFYRTVTDIDYMDIGGMRRKIIVLDSGEKWIEGIGSSQGIIHSGMDGEQAVYLTSYMEGSKLLYSSTPKEDCICTRTVDVYNNKDVVVYPDKIYLHNLIGYTFELMDIHGRVLMKCEIDVNDYFVNCDEIIAGVYLYRVRKDGDVHTFSKFIKR